MESHDPYGRLKRGKVVSYVHSTDPRIRSSGSPSVTFHSPTGARSVPELLEEIQTELDGHPRRDSLESYGTMVRGSLRTVRENLRDGNMGLVSIELYRLGVWVERMRAELHPSKGGPAKSKASPEDKPPIVARIQKLIDGALRKNPDLTMEAAFHATKGRHPIDISYATFKVWRRQIKTG